MLRMVEVVHSVTLLDAALDEGEGVAEGVSEGSSAQMELSGAAEETGGEMMPAEATPKARAAAERMETRILMVGFGCC